MEFDEYEYLEKSVEDPESRSSKKKDNTGSDKREKGYRKRDETELEGDDRNRNREDGEDDERKRKKSRGGDDESNGGGERRREERERSERRRDKDERHRSRDRDGERDRDRDRDRRDRERRDRDRDKERERERERRERERERERERSRPRRSSSRSRLHDGRERERERDRDKELRDVETRDSRRFKDKKEAVEPEADPERDQRTVFAYQMPLKVTERDVYEFFSKAGKVRDVRLIMDRNSRRSKGVGNAIKISMMRNDGHTFLSCLINSCSFVKNSIPTMTIRV